METRAAIKRRLAAARERGDWALVSKLHQWLIIEAAERGDRDAIRQTIELQSDKIENAIASGDSQTARSILILLVFSLTKWFEQTLYGFALEAVTELTADVAAQMTREQMTASIGLPLFEDMGIVPPVVDLVPDVPEVLTERDELLLFMAPFLAVSPAIGPTAAGVLFDGVKSDGLIGVRVESSKETNLQWRASVADTMERAAAKILPIADQPEPKIEDVKKNVNLAFGIKGVLLGGALGSLAARLRHEKLRIAAQTREDIRNAIPDDVAVGYILHSRFLSTTDPDHAANDGSLFYRDDRPGVKLPWAERLIPPYRTNCVCYTDPLFDDPAGIGFGPEFGIRLSRQRSATIRNVGGLSSWFNQQRPDVRREMFGNRSYLAAAAKGNGTPRFADFYNPNGSQVPIRRLLDESSAARESRIRQVEDVIREKSRQYDSGWQQHRSRFGTDRSAEAEYRRQLEELLRRTG